jgi:cellulose synthase/poly-beta-1,6-N-acetylglucosamine synthase-like glycosyltransferase
MIWLLLIPALIYFFIFLNIFRNLKKIGPYKPAGEASVKISVIIACRNEEKNLPDLLSNLSTQDYNADLLEVIVVDDNSVDKTFRTALEWKGIKNYKVIQNPSKGKKSAIRFGVNNASGELIITTDADCRPGTRWISTLAAFYSLNHPDMIIGPVRLDSGSGFFASFQELEFLSLQGVTAATSNSGNPVMCNGANLGFNREIYFNHSNNLHNEISSGDDIFLLHSLKKDHDSKIVWISSSDAIVDSRQTDSIGSFIKQRVRWISKAGFYNDSFTLLIGFVTFVTILSIVYSLISGIINHEYLLMYLASFVIKSIPDFLIISEVTERYKRKHLLRWFIPSQIVYPFYVIIVVCSSLFWEKSWK